MKVIFLHRLDSSLRSDERANGISDYAIYAEQQSRDLFNLALSRNVAARAALDDGASGSFSFHDVDIIPLRGVDYGPRSFNVAWFLSASSCKVMVADFVTANRCNPNFVVWGDEDEEFYHRLEHVGCAVKEWHRDTDSSRQAVVANLEWPEMSDEEAPRGLRATSGTRAPGLGSSPIGPAMAASKGTINRATSLDPQRRRRWRRMRVLPPDDKSAYIARDELKSGQGRSRGSVNSGPDPMDQIPNGGRLIR